VTRDRVASRAPCELWRVRRDVQGGLVSGEIRGAPTLFIDGIVHRGGYEAASLLRVRSR
jgi:hypothetical protein